MTEDDAALDAVWVLSSSVSLRAEPMGALAYHFGNRRLTFLKRPELVRVVESFDGTCDVRSALERAQVPQEQWPEYLGAIARLEDADMIARVETVAVAHG